DQGDEVGGVGGIHDRLPPNNAPDRGGPSPPPPPSPSPSSGGPRPPPPPRRPRRRARPRRSRGRPLQPLPETVTAHSRQKRAPCSGGGKMSTRSSVNPVTAAAALSLSDRTRASIAVSQVAEPRPEGPFAPGRDVLGEPRVLLCGSR